MIEALVGKEKRCDSHYLGIVGKICIDLEHKSTVFGWGKFLDVLESHALPKCVQIVSHFVLHLLF